MFMLLLLVTMRKTLLNRHNYFDYLNLSILHGSSQDPVQLNFKEWTQSWLISRADAIDTCKFVGNKLIPVKCSMEK